MKGRQGGLEGETRMVATKHNERWKGVVESGDGFKLFDKSETLLKNHHIYIYILYAPFLPFECKEKTEKKEQMIKGIPSEEE